MKHDIYIMDRGWIIIGQEICGDSDSVTLNDASVVRKWSNGKGIGGLACEANKDEYMLDAVGEVKLFKRSMLFRITCEW